MALFPFIEKRFPEDISYGSSGGPKFQTEVFASVSGGEQRSALWSAAKAEYNVAHGIKTREQMDVLVAFFYEMRGRATGFRFKDWLDFTITGMQFGVGDNTTTIFQLSKTYNTASAQKYVRAIRKPVQGTLSGFLVGGVPQIENTSYTVDYTTGLVTFSVPPPSGHVVVAGLAEFDVPVRFDVDHLDVAHEFWETMSWPSIGLKELLPQS